MKGRSVLEEDEGETLRTEKRGVGGGGGGDELDF